MMLHCLSLERRSSQSTLSLNQDDVESKLWSERIAERSSRTLAIAMSCCVWNEFSIAIVQFNECRQHASSWLWKVLRFNDVLHNVRFKDFPQHASSWLWKVLRFNDGPQNASLWIGVTSVALVLVAVAELLL